MPTAFAGNGYSIDTSYGFDTIYLNSSTTPLIGTIANDETVVCARAGLVPVHNPGWDNLHTGGWQGTATDSISVWTSTPTFTYVNYNTANNQYLSSSGFPINVYNAYVGAWISCGNAAAPATVTKQMAWKLGIVYNKDHIPPSNISIIATPTSGTNPLSVILNGSIKGPSTATSWLWNFGDASFGATTQNTTHVFTSAGNYTVGLQVIDSSGATLNTNTTITVLPPSLYYFPVNIVDAITGNNIFVSNLSTELYGSGNWHNWTGSYGFFNVTGTGVSGNIPINYLNKILADGSAPNYAPNEISKIISVPQMFPISLPLSPLNLMPKSGEVTIAVDVFNNVTGAPISNAYVVLSNPNKTLTGYTTSAGTITFSNLSSADTHLITVTKSGFNTAMPSVYAPTGGLIYKSIGLDSASSVIYSAVCAPLSPVIGQTITLTIISSSIGSLTGSYLNTLEYINLVDFSTDSGEVYSQIGGNKGYNLWKDNISSNWYGNGYNGTVSLGSTLVLPTFILQSAGVHQLRLTLTDAASHNTYYSNFNITVQGTASDLNLVIYPYDQITGNSISQAEYDILDPITNIWNNVTEFGISHLVLGIQTGRYYTGKIKAINYVDQPFSFYTGFTNGISDGQTGNVNYMISLYPIINNIGAGNVSLNVEVWDKNTIPLIGSSVSLISASTGISYGSSKTGLNGAATFIVPMNDTYKATASFSGYQTGTSSIIVTTVSPVSMSIYLTKLITPTITSVITIPTTSSGVTITPTIQSGVYSNGTCITGNTQNLTLLDQLKNNLACNGVKTKTNQDLAIGALIIFVFMIVGGKWGKGIGVICGASAGYIISIAMDLIPIWTFFALLVLAGLIFGIKLFSSGE